MALATGVLFGLAASRQALCKVPHIYRQCGKLGGVASRAASALHFAPSQHYCRPRLVLSGRVGQTPDKTAIYPAVEKRNKRAQGISPSFCPRISSHSHSKNMQLLTRIHIVDWSRCEQRSCSLLVFFQLKLSCGRSSSFSSFN